jgi:DNA-binding transcriptional regulator YiaG
MNQFNEISELEADNIEIQNFFKSKKKLYNPVLFNIVNVNQIEEKQKPIIMDAFEVKKIREELGLSQQKFADQIGVDRRTVVNWEQGKTIPESKIKLLKLMSTGIFKEKEFNTVSKVTLTEPDLFNNVNLIEEKQKPIIMNALDVKKIREELYLTQQKFAKEIGVDRRTVANWEQGKLIPESKIKLLKLISLGNSAEMVSSSPIEKNEVRNQTIDHLNREIMELNDHIKTLKESILDKNSIVDMYKNENILLKEKLAILDK